jgi:hypothetical protein
MGKATDGMIVLIRKEICLPTHKKNIEKPSAQKQEFGSPSL